MRVIETFVTSVPREKIPADAKWFMQDPDDGLLKISNLQVKPGFRSDFWLRGGDRVDNPGSLYTLFTKPISIDAAETVVTREELMRAYDLVEQGYTLWFGGECPISNGVIIDVAMKSDNRYPHVVSADGIWGEHSEIIAYRLTRSVDKDVAAVNRVANARDAAPLVELDHADTIVAVAIEKRLTLDALDKWGSNFDKICVDPETGYLASNSDNLVIITRAQWDDYVSRKIRVGDKVKTDRSNVATVLFIGEKTAFVKFQSGAEMAINLNRLTRIPQ